MTRWVLTIPTDDGLTAHVFVDSEDHGDELLRDIAAHFEQPVETIEYVLEEVPATWECDGRDGCAKS